MVAAGEPHGAVHPYMEKTKSGDRGRVKEEAKNMGRDGVGRSNMAWQQTAGAGAGDWETGRLSFFFALKTFDDRTTTITTSNRSWSL